MERLALLISNLSFWVGKPFALGMEAASFFANKSKKDIAYSPTLVVTLKLFNIKDFFYEFSTRVLTELRVRSNLVSFEFGTLNDYLL